MTVDKLITAISIFSYVKRYFYKKAKKTVLNCFKSISKLTQLSVLLSRKLLNKSEQPLLLPPNLK